MNQLQHVTITTIVVLFSGLPNVFAQTGAWRAAANKAKPLPAATGRRPVVDSRVQKAANKQAITPIRDAGTVSDQQQAKGLPTAAGQIWREYDIRAYTERIRLDGSDAGTKAAEQTIVDWIVRETGTDTWFSQPGGMLTAGPDVIRVYHSPSVQRRVEAIIRRFTDAKGFTLTARMMSVGNSSWRLPARPLLQPVPVQSPGVQAWILSREDAARLLVDLQRRNDFREHRNGQLMVGNGDSRTVNRYRSTSYPQSVELTADGWPGYRLEMGNVDIGFALTVTPLAESDADIAEATLKFRVDQLERFRSMWVDVPIAQDPKQRVQIQVPQTNSWQLHERFRWPTDRVLLVSCGLVATPPKTGLANLAPGIANSGLINGPKRAELLLMLDGRENSSVGSGSADGPQNAAGKSRFGSLDTRGRY